MKSVWLLLAISKADVWHGEEDIATLENIEEEFLATQNTGKLSSGTWWHFL